MRGVVFGRIVWYCRKWRVVLYPLGVNDKKSDCERKRGKIRMSDEEKFRIFRTRAKAENE